MEKDDLGIEMDDDVAAYLKDPKAGLLGKVLDYRDRRNKKIAENEAERLKKEEKDKKDEKFLGIF